MTTYETDEQVEEGGEQSFCASCGVPVVWADRANPQAMKRGLSQRHPPLEPIGNVKTIRAGVVHTTPAYRMHFCRKDEKDAYSRLRASQRAAADAAFAQVRTSAARTEPAWKTRMQERLWEVARVRECPKCGAEVDEPCMNLSERRHGREKPTSQPHVERFPGGAYPVLEDE